MSRRIAEQLLLVPAEIDHQRARELATMSAILDEVFPQLVDAVERDLCADVDVGKGRRGLTAEQVVRVAMLKQMTSLSYKRLAFHLLDSATFRRFCKIPAFASPPGKSTLQENVKLLKDATLERLNRLIVERAKLDGIEDGNTIRVDSTVIASHIHHPTDSALLFDSTRVLARLMRKTRRAKLGSAFVNRTRVAKKRSLAIANAKSMDERRPIYRDLMKVTAGTIKDSKRSATTLERQGRCIKRERRKALALRLAARLRHFIAIAERVVEQTRRRVVEEESVPAEEKIVSIFETHTNVIRKDRRQTLYGHKITLSSGKSGLVLDAIIHEGNPPDSTQAVPMVERHKEAFGRAPRQAAFDGGYTSKENLKALKRAKVKDVAFARRLGLKLTDMVKNSRVFRALRNFRAGIEATISFLKRCFGLACCTWESLESFKAYVWSSIASANLLMLARRRLALA